MAGWSFMAKILIGFGLVSLILGLLFLVLSRFFPIGHLPGDFYYQRGNFVFYFPLVTCIVLSLILTLILNLFFRR
jgi:hypothetical protein